MLAYALLVVLVAGVAALRHLQSNRLSPAESPPLATEVEERVTQVLLRFGAGPVRVDVPRYGDGSRLIDADLPDSVSLTRLNLALGEALDGLSIEAADCRLAEHGQTLDCRYEHAGALLVELRARRVFAQTGLDATGPELPKVAIIIDDLGHSQQQVVLDLVDLDPRLTFGVLPGRPHSRALAWHCYQGGREVILHQPMEPLAALNPGPYALTTDMEEEDLEGLLRANLDRVPCAVGVNNHMGSRATADSTLMAHFMAAMADQAPLYFVDSRTSIRSVALSAARRRGVPAAATTVFLDDQNEPEAIAAALDLLGRIAWRRGSAIGIGHPRQQTYEALALALGEMEGQIWNLVPASVVVGMERT